MVTPRKQVKGPEVPHLPLGAGDNVGSKYLIAAVFAAGKNGCDCEACQLLKRFGGELSTLVLKENDGD